MRLRGPHCRFQVGQLWQSSLLHRQASQGAVPEVDPAAAKKAAEEAEDRRLAEIRAHGTPVTPATFAPWKERFYLALAAARARCAAGGSLSSSSLLMLVGCKALVCAARSCSAGRRTSDCDDVSAWLQGAAAGGGWQPTAADREAVLPTGRQSDGTGVAWQSTGERAC